MQHHVRSNGKNPSLHLHDWKLLNKSDEEDEAVHSAKDDQIFHSSCGSQHGEIDLCQKSCNWTNTLMNAKALDPG